MEKKKKYFIKVLSQSAFDEEMLNRGLNDDNVEALAGEEAFISIIGTPDCLKYYLDEEDTNHYFSRRHKNVINLSFDDLEMDIEYDGHTFYAMTPGQSRELYEFIEANKESSFTIHCRAGFSRSQAVACFIIDFYKDIYNKDNTDMATIHREHANQDVLRKLKLRYYEEKDIFADVDVPADDIDDNEPDFYSDDNIEVDATRNKAGYVDIAFSMYGHNFSDYRITDFQAETLYEELGLLLGKDESLNRVRT